jgi:hypothetical protein
MAQNIFRKFCLVYFILWNIFLNFGCGSNVEYQHRSTFKVTKSLDSSATIVGDRFEFKIITVKASKETSGHLISKLKLQLRSELKERLAVVETSKASVNEIHMNIIQSPNINSSKNNSEGCMIVSDVSIQAAETNAELGRFLEKTYFPCQKIDEGIRLHGEGIARTMLLQYLSPLSPEEYQWAKQTEEMFVEP